MQCSIFCLQIFYWRKKGFRAFPPSPFTTTRDYPWTPLQLYLQTHESWSIGWCFRDRHGASAVLQIVATLTCSDTDTCHDDSAITRTWLRMQSRPWCIFIHHSSDASAARLATGYSSVLYLRYRWVTVTWFLPRCMECQRGLRESCLSVCQTRGLWHNGIKIRPDFLPYERPFSLVFWE